MSTCLYSRVGRVAISKDNNKRLSSRPTTVVGPEDVRADHVESVAQVAGPGPVGHLAKGLQHCRPVAVLAQLEHVLGVGGECHHGHLQQGDRERGGGDIYCCCCCFLFSSSSLSSSTSPSSFFFFLCHYCHRQLSGHFLTTLIIGNTRRKH